MESRTRRGTERLLRCLREPAVPMLVLAGIAMLRRDFVPDIAFAFGAAVVILADAPRWATGLGGAAPRPATGRSRALAFATIAAIGLGLVPNGPWLDGAFAVIGMLALVVCLRPGLSPGVPGVPRTPHGWRAWPALGVGFALVELVSLLAQPRPMVDSPAHPSLSTVIEPALALWPMRLLAAWLWLLAGWWIVRRLRAWTP